MSSNLEYYKVFYYVAQLKSITLAAEKLCISQPAVSQAVRQLEKALDSQLFLRTSKGVRLTREGEFFLRICKIRFRKHLAWRKYVKQAKRSGYGRGADRSQ